MQYKDPTPEQIQRQRWESTERKDYYPSGEPILEKDMSYIECRDRLRDTFYYRTTFDLNYMRTT